MHLNSLKSITIVLLILSVSACSHDDENSDGLGSADFIEISINGAAAQRLTPSTSNRGDPILWADVSNLYSDTIVGAFWSKVGDLYEYELTIAANGTGTGAQEVGSVVYDIDIDGIHTGYTYYSITPGNGSAEVIFTEFGAVGEPIAGNFTATLCDQFGALNADSDCSDVNFQVSVTGSFSITRGANRD
jgi:hypothetical protein